MDSNLQGCGTTRCTTWVPSSTYEKKDDEEPGGTTAGYSQVNDGSKPDELWGSRLGKGGREVSGLQGGGKVRLRVGSANVGSMRGRHGEVVEMARRRQLDFVCLQETRWKGGSARTLGGYKFFWVGCEEGISGVGVLVAEKWIDKVMEVNRVNERILVVRVIVGRKVLNIISVYAPQTGRNWEEKEEFYITLGKTLALAGPGEHLMVCGDLNGHVGAKKDGFDDVHGGYGFGSRNVEGEMLLECADAWNLAVTNTWFKKESAKLVTYESGGVKTVVDYILVRKHERKMVQNVFVIPGEACLQQHKLLVCVLNLSETGRKGGDEKFVGRCKLWKLKKVDIRNLFRQRVQERADTRSAGNVDTIWNELRNCLLEVSEDLCGKARGRQRHEKTWWWNDDVAKVIKEKQRLFRIYDKSKGTEEKTLIEENKQRYLQIKREAKKAVHQAQEIEYRKFGEKLDIEDGKGNIFRVAKQIVRKNKDVVGAGGVKDKDGKIVVDEENILDVWQSYYDKLSNEEFVWDKNTITNVELVSGPCERLSEDEIRKAITKMKCNKAAGPSGVVADMLKAAGEAVVPWVTELCNAVVKDGRVPRDWSRSWMINVYKGKGDALECSSYRGIKLLEHVMKVLEKVIDSRVRNIVKIDEMQFGFMPGKGTTDAIFIVRQLQEKYLGKKRELWMAFVDLEKAFDRVPREVVWWALRTLGVDEWIVSVIRAMYEDATTSVKLNGKESKGFSVRVGVHQGSGLSPLLFIIVLEALSRAFREGLPMELFYADDLVLIAETLELLKVKILKWKMGMEEKGLRVNMGKTKIMHCADGSGQVKESGKWPCAVCRKGVGANSIMCTTCNAWVHKKCCGISGDLVKAAQQFRCKTCVEGRTAVLSEETEIELENYGKLECVKEFRYLGDVIGAGGGAGEASIARVRSAWAKFRELAPILTSRGASLKVKGKVYKTCVQTVMLYGGETWPVKVEELHRLERTERMMVRWMCGVTLKDRVDSVELRSRLGIWSVGELLRRNRLRWFGHLERKDNEEWVSACRRVEVVGARARGRVKKTWEECVKNDLDLLGLRRDWAQDRAKWRGLIWGKRPTRASMEKRT